MKLVASYQLSVVIIVLLFFSGCGFHLRGAGADFHLNLQRVYIQSESAESVATEVKRLLIEEGVQIVPITKEAQAVVYLRNETVDKRVLSVSSISGKQEELEINYSLEMEVRKPDESILLKKQYISLSRDYRFDETAVLAAEAEEEKLREDMFRDIVGQVMRRLQIIKIDE